MNSSASAARPSPVLVAVPLMLLVGTFGLIVNKLAKPVTNTDTYFHIRMGAEFLSDWTPWSPGSVTRFASADWVPSQWLGQVAYGAADHYLGLPGVAWLSGAVVLLFALTLYLVTRSSGSLVISSFVVPVTVLACAPALSGRPQVLSYVFTAMVTAAWVRTRSTGKVAWWIVPVTWVWALFHGMWPVGILISIVGAIGILLDHEAAKPRVRDLILLPLLSLGAAALTPVGPAIYSAVLRVGSINSYFAEWGPTEFTHPSTAVATLTVVLLLVVAMRSGPMRWTTLLLTLLTGAWLLYSIRTVPIAASMLAPLVTVELARFVPDRGRTRFETPVVLTGFAAALVVLALIVPHTSAQAMHEGNRAHESITRLPAGSGVINEWAAGGYDMWAHPQLDVLMHGYGDMFTDAELQRNYDLDGLEKGWDDVVVLLDLRHALLPSDSRVAYALTEHLGWDVVVEDDGLVHLRAPSQ